MVENVESSGWRNIDLFPYANLKLGNFQNWEEKKKVAPVGSEVECSTCCFWNEKNFTFKYRKFECTESLFGQICCQVS